MYWRLLDVGTGDCQTVVAEITGRLYRRLLDVCTGDYKTFEPFVLEITRRFPQRGLRLLPQRGWPTTGASESHENLERRPLSSEYGIYKTVNGLGFHATVLETFDCFSSSVDSGGGGTGHVLESGGEVTRQEVFRNVEVRADRPV